MNVTHKIKKYGTLVGGYGLGIFLNQGINLILIPVFWTILKPEDFGIIALTQIISLILAPVYLFGASETIQRFYYKWSDSERPHYLGWIFWFVLVATFLLSILLDLIGSHYFKYFIVNVPFDPLLRFSIWSVFFTNLINIPIAISRIKQKILTYNILVNGSFFTQISIVIYLVKFENLGAYGYIKGFLIANILWFIPTIFLTAKDIAIFPKLIHRKIPFSYAGPMWASGMVDGVSLCLDRYFLDKFLPLATIGFYNLARQFAGIINLVNSVTKLSFIPYIYKINVLKNHTSAFLGHFGIIYSTLMTLPVVFVCIFSNDLVTLLDPSGVYQQICAYIPYFAVSFYFSALGTILGRGMDLSGITKWSFLPPLLGSTVSLIIYINTLPEHGVWGILLSLLIGNFIRNLLNILLGIYYFPRRLFLSKMFVGWFVALIFYVILTKIDLHSEFLNLTVKLSLLLIMFGLQIKFLLKENLSYLFNLFIGGKNHS